MGAADPRLVHQHRHPSSYEGVPAGRRDAVLHLAQLVQSLGGQPGIDAAVERGGMRALLLAEGEEAAPVEVGPGHEVQQGVVVLLGLTGVADYEVGPEGGIRFDGPDVVDPLHEAVAVAPAAHPTHQRWRDVLERQVEVWDTGRADRVDQPIAQLRRVEVEKPHTVDPVSHRLDQRDDGLHALALVAAVGGQVLGHQDHLPGVQAFDLVQDGLYGSTPLWASEGRDCTEPARPVTALGDLHVGPGPVRRGPRQVQEVERRQCRLAVEREVRAAA